jgi:RNA 2',3'-cyclic 3'-phosphodiesterase
MRCFLALRLDDETRDKLAAIQRRLAQPGDGIRWVRAENLHLTLQFLGEQGEAELEGLALLLRELPSREPLQLSLGELGFFGSTRRPRVVQMGLCGEVERLQQLVTELGQSTEAALGLPPEEREYHPHITLGRVKKVERGMAERLLASLGSDLDEGARPLQPLRSLWLMRSILEPTGIRYEPLEEFAFAPHRGYL